MFETIRNHIKKMADAITLEPTDACAFRESCPLYASFEGKNMDAGKCTQSLSIKDRLSLCGEYQSNLLKKVSDSMRELCTNYTFV